MLHWNFRAPSAISSQIRCQTCIPCTKNPICFGETSIALKGIVDHSHALSEIELSWAMLIRWQGHAVCSFTSKLLAMPRALCARITHFYRPGFFLTTKAKPFSMEVRQAMLPYLSEYLRYVAFREKDLRHHACKAIIFNENFKQCAFDFLWPRRSGHDILDPDVFGPRRFWLRSFSHHILGEKWSLYLLHVA